MNGVDFIKVFKTVDNPFLHLQNVENRAKKGQYRKRALYAKKSHTQISDKIID